MSEAESPKEKIGRTLPIPPSPTRKLSDSKAPATRKKSSSVEKPVDQLDPVNEKAILSWKGPAKETKSARLRREMNAGKGGRRSLSASSEDLASAPSGTTEWVRNRLFEQKTRIQSLEDEMEELKKTNKIQEVNRMMTLTSKVQNSISEKDVNIAKLKKLNEEKDGRIEAELAIKNNTESEMKRFKSKSQILEAEFKKLKTLSEEDQQKMRALEVQLKKTEQTLQTTQNTLETTQATMKTNEGYFVKQIEEYQRGNTNLTEDQNKLIETIKEMQKENNELKEKISKISDDLTLVKNEKSHLEETCKKYETELTERIKESLSMMDDMDNTKAMVSHQTIKLNDREDLIQKQKNQLNEKNNQIEDLVQSRERLEKTISSQNEKIEEINDVIKSRDSKINQLEGSLVDFTTSSNEKADIINNFMKENNLLKEKLLEKDEHLKEMKILHDKLESQFKSHEMMSTENADKSLKDMEHLKHEIDDLNTKCELLERECEEERHLCQAMKTENEKYKLKMEELKENVLNSVKGMNDKAIIVNNLMDENSTLKEKLNENKETIKKLQAEVDGCKQELKENKISHNTETVEQKQIKQTLENDLKFYKTQVNTLQNDLNQNENVIQEKNDDMVKLQNSMNELQSNFTDEKNVQLGQIKTLQLDLDDKVFNVKQSEDINKQLQISLSQLDKRYKQKEQRIEVLELENKNLKKENEKLNELESVIEIKNKELERMSTKSQEQESRHEKGLASVKKQHAKEINNLQDELDTSINKSREEINELLNNFSELENELNFCQEELNSKLDKTDDLRRELDVIETNNALKDMKFKTDLETISEQNENILHNEIQKHKTETDNVIVDLKQRHLDEINKLHLQHQNEMADQEQRKDQEIEKLKLDKKSEVEQLLTEKQSLLKKYDVIEEEIEKDTKKLQLDCKAKTLEIESKSRIIDKLSRRIETQQKLIDYLMKSLEKERNQRGASSKDILTKLSGLQQQIDDRFSTSFNDLSSRKSLTPATSFSALPFTEINLSPPQKSPSESSLQFQGDDAVKGMNFMPLTASSPRNGYKPNKTLPAMSINNDRVHNYVSSLDSNYLSQSMPDIQSPDLGYHSPSYETNTVTFYFAEQIKAISNTFDKIERLDGAESANDQLSLEMWKQKIHFRLKVLEDQICEMDTSSNVSSSSNKSLNDSRMQSLSDLTNSPNGVVFHPSTEEIRKLINNVNRRYEHLNRKHYSKVYSDSNV